MKRKLWTVPMDRMPAAVVAASCKREAGRIIAALKEHGDLPPGQMSADIDLCPPGQSAKIMRLARELGVANSFLACIRGGMFLTWLGGLNDEFSLGVEVERAA